MGQALRLVLLTGVRVDELAGAEIRELDRLDDRAGATWTIPAARSKNGRAHVIPLSAPALDIVTDLLEQANLRAGDEVKPRYILASPVDLEKSIDGHSLSVAMSRFGNALAVGLKSKPSAEEEGGAIRTWVAERPTAHDLRRTMATRMAGSGIPAEDVSACLNHTRKGVTAMHYDHYDRAREKRLALTTWAQQVEKIVGELCDYGKIPGTTR